MLIDKQTTIEVNDIITIKLLSGEEIVGKLVELTKDSITLAKPISVMMQQAGLVTMPLLGSVEPHTSLKILRTAMSIYPVKTSDQVTASYREMTSGIITPAKNGLIS